MKKLLVLIFLMLPLAAQAHHHRGHASMHLLEAETFLVEAISNMEGFAEGKDLAPWYQNALAGWNKSAPELLERVRQLRADLDSGNLDELRREVEQPAYYNGEPSIIRQTATGPMSQLGNLVPAVRSKQELAQLRLAIKNLSRAWLFISIANWHIQDAIREEIYEDPVFICSGPGNHC